MSTAAANRVQTVFSVLPCRNVGTNSSSQFRSQPASKSCVGGLASLDGLDLPTSLKLASFAELLLLKTPGETPDCKESLARKSSLSRLASRMISEKDVQILETGQSSPISVVPSI